MSSPGAAPLPSRLKGQQDIERQPDTPPDSSPAWWCRSGFRAIAGSLAAILALYAAAAAWLASTHSVWSPDCGARLIQVQSLLEHWPHWWVSYPGQALDPQHQNSSLYFYEYTHGTHTYVFYSFLFAILSAGFFQVFGYFGLTILPMLGGAGSALAACGLARQMGIRFPLAPMLLVALATPLAVYSVVFWDHSITTCFAAVCLYLAVRAVSRQQPKLWFLSGCILGAGLWFHEILIPYFPALVAAAWCARKQQPWLKNAVLLAVGAGLPVTALAVVNQSVYGTPFGPHLSNNHLGSPSAIAGFLEQPSLWGPGALYTLFAWGDANPGFTWQFRGWLDHPFPQLQKELSASYWMAVPVLIWLALSVTGLWRAPTRRFSLPGARGTIPVDGWWLAMLTFLGLMADGKWVLLHDQWPHSLFYACPVLVLALAGGRRPPAVGVLSSPLEAQEGTARRMVIAAALVYTVLALFNPALGGSEWGSRYLLITVPALAIFAWSAFERLLPAPGPSGDRAWDSGAKPLLCGMCLLLGLSVALQAHGLRVVRTMHDSNHQLAVAFEQTPDPVIVTTIWWTPLDAASMYQKKLFVYAGDADHPAPPLLRRLREAGYRTYALVGYTPWDLAAFARQEGYLPLAGTARTLPFQVNMARYGIP